MLKSPLFRRANAANAPPWLFCMAVLSYNDHMPRLPWAPFATSVCTLVFLAAACSTVPYTNRTQLMLMSESSDLQLGAAAYQEVLKKAPINHDPELNAPVQRVGRRIAAVANKPDYQWEFTVIDDPKQANAFCLPGGKVAVYTGIFPIAHDEAGLATVIGHEVAHALARHGAERVSQMELLQIGAVGVAAATSGTSPGLQQAILQAYGVGSAVGVALPFSRKQESEADHIGLLLMAQAGYDPEAAVGLWQRMEAAERGSHPPQWLSTHPSPETRVQDLQSWMAEAKQYYKPTGAAVALLPPIPGAPRPASHDVGENEPKYR
jgi:predicted Zn-dependent protease